MTIGNKVSNIVPLIKCIRKFNFYPPLPLAQQIKRLRVNKGSKWEIVKQNFHKILKLGNNVDTKLNNGISKTKLPQINLKENLDQSDDLIENITVKKPIEKPVILIGDVLDNKEQEICETESLLYSSTIQRSNSNVRQLSTPTSPSMADTEICRQEIKSSHNSTETENFSNNGIIRNKFHMNSESALNNEKFKTEIQKSTTFTKTTPVDDISTYPINVRALRSRANSLNAYSNTIVLILKEDPTSDDISIFEENKGLLYILGSPSDAVYNRAQINEADTVIILNDIYNEQSKDSMVVLETKSLTQRCSEKTKILSDLVNPKFMSHIRSFPENSEEKQILSEIAYSNKNAPFLAEALYVQGESIASFLVDSLICQAYFNENILSLLHSLLLPCSQKCQASSHRTYKNFYLDQLRNFNNLSLGLYRYVSTSNISGFFVFADPPGSILIGERDLCYVCKPCSNSIY